MRGARRYQSNPETAGQSVTVEAYEGSRGLAEASRRPQGRLAPVGPQPPRYWQLAKRR